MAVKKFRRHKGKRVEEDDEYVCDNRKVKLLSCAKNKSQNDNNNSTDEYVNKRNNKYESYMNKSKKKKLPFRNAKKKLLKNKNSFAYLSFKLKKSGFYIREILADGNCLFRAFADQIDGNENNHFIHRKKAMEYLRNNKEQYECFIEDDEKFDCYVTRMSRESQWAGQLELHILSMLHHVNVIVHQQDGLSWEMQNFDEQHPCVQLSYHNGEHYNSVRFWDDDEFDGAKKFSLKVLKQNKFFEKIKKKKNEENEDEDREQQDEDDVDSKMLVKMLNVTGSENSGLALSCIEHANNNFDLALKLFKERARGRSVSTEEKEIFEKNDNIVLATSKDVNDNNDFFCEGNNMNETSNVCEDSKGDEYAYNSFCSSYLTSEEEDKENNSETEDENFSFLYLIPCPLRRKNKNRKRTSMDDRGCSDNSNDNGKCYHNRKRSTETTRLGGKKRKNVFVANNSEINRKSLHSSSLPHSFNLSSQIKVEDNRNNLMSKTLTERDIASCLEAQKYKLNNKQKPRTFAWKYLYVYPYNLYNKAKPNDFAYIQNHHSNCVTTNPSENNFCRDSLRNFCYTPAYCCMHGHAYNSIPCHHNVHYTNINNFYDSDSRTYFYDKIYSKNYLNFHFGNYFSCDAHNALINIKNNHSNAHYSSNLFPVASIDNNLASPASHLFSFLGCSNSNIIFRSNLNEHSNIS